MNEANAVPPSTRRTIPWHSIRSLTRIRQDSGDAYIREPYVSAQIARFCGLTDKERRKALAEGYEGKDPNRPKEETIVYFIREYDRRGDKDAAWELLAVLVNRIPGHVRRELAKWRLPESEQDECMESLVTELYAFILSHEPREEFWEVRFWVCLDRRIHAYAEKLQRVRDREIRPADDFEAEDDGARGAEGVFAQIADKNASPEIIALRKDLQRRLSEIEWQAVFLKYIEKLPEESGDATKVTIATLLGVTGRSVRNYLRRAERKLLEGDGDSRNVSHPERGARAQHETSPALLPATSLK